MALLPFCSRNLLVFTIPIPRKNMYSIIFYVARCSFFNTLGVFAPRFLNLLNVEKCTSVTLILNMV